MIEMAYKYLDIPLSPEIFFEADEQSTIEDYIMDLYYPKNKETRIN